MIVTTNLVQDLSMAGYYQPGCFGDCSDAETETWEREVISMERAWRGAARRYAEASGFSDIDAITTSSGQVLDTNTHTLMSPHRVETWEETIWQKAHDMTPVDPDLYPTIHRGRAGRRD